MALRDIPHDVVLRFPADFPSGPLFTAPPVLSRLREERPVSPVQMPSGNRLWLVTRYADVRTVMFDDRFSRELTYDTAPRMAGDDLTSIKGSLFNMEGADHARVRKPLNSYFNRRAVQDWGATVRRHADALLEKMAATKNSGDLVKEFSEPLIAQVAAELMTITPDEHAWIQDVIRRQLDLEGTKEGIAAATAEILAFAEKLAARSACPVTGGPAAALVEAARTGEITRQEAVASISLLLMNITDPLIPPLTTGPMTLLLHPEQLQDCKKDATLWTEAVSEVLRYHNNGITNFPRVAVTDVELGGVLISEGEGVITSNLAASHDPERFPDPDVFDVHRADKGSLFFGAGSHFCLGSAFGPKVLATAYEALFTRLPDLRLAVDPHSVRKADGGFFARPGHLPVEW